MPFCFGNGIYIQSDQIRNFFHKKEDIPPKTSLRDFTPDSWGIMSK